MPLNEQWAPEDNTVLDGAQNMNGEKHLDPLHKLSHVDILNSEITESTFLQQNKIYVENYVSVCAYQACGLSQP